MKLTFHTYDVFTARKFAGNPLAIVEDADDLSTEQMQTIAREFNLSETIFIRKPKDPAHTASVRIFFPTAEIPFAGHPTVGCAIHLAQKKYKPGCSFETTITLEEVAGLVPVKVSRIGDVPRAQFTAPVTPFAVDLPLPSVEDVARALALEPSDIGFDGHGLGLFQGGPRFFYVPLKSREALQKAKPIEPHWSRMVSAMGHKNAYLYTRGGDTAATQFRAACMRRVTASPKTRQPGRRRRSSPRSFCAARGCRTALTGSSSSRATRWGAPPTSGSRPMLQVRNYFRCALQVRRCKSCPVC